MNVIQPKTSGFCPGIRFAERSLEQLLKDRPDKKVRVIGDLVHNSRVVGDWERKGAVTCKDGEAPGDGTLVAIRTHGIDRRAEEKLRKNYEVFDLTCSKVKHLQNYINYYSGNGFFVVIVGDRSHPETQGLASYAVDQTVIGDEADLFKFMDEYHSGKGIIARKSYCKILVLSQTTGRRPLFEKTARTIQEECGQACEVKILDSICAFNTLREEDALRMQKDADLTVVIGENISSNSVRLHETLKAAGGNAWLVPDLNAFLKLGLDLKKYNKALVVSGSSTPAKIENELVEYLLNV